MWLYSMLYVLGVAAIILSILVDQYFFLALFFLAALLGSGIKHRVFIAICIGIVIGVIADIFWVLPFGTGSLLYGMFVIVYELYGLRFNVRSPLFLFVYAVLYSVGFYSLLSIHISKAALIIFVCVYVATSVYMHNREVGEVGIVEEV
ncbi:MAG: hypothetical protein NUV65_02890 [Candidatus Roizmanbacteria bacterium]|nr:hypothetical protein [Candidatus Roizmanbacteria bacterium]